MFELLVSYKIHQTTDASMKFNQTHFRKSAHHTETNPHQRSGGNDKMDHSFSNNVGGIVYTTYTTHSAHQHQLIDASHVPAIRTDPRVAFGKSLLCIISEGTILAGAAPAVNHKASDSLTTNSIANSRFSTSHPNISHQNVCPQNRSLGVNCGRIHHAAGSLDQSAS